MSKSPITDIAKKVCPATITIVASRDLPSLEDLMNAASGGKTPQAPIQDGEKKEKTKVGGGSGFIVSEDGFIITCNHVVADDQCEYSIIVSPTQKYQAQILARDPLVDLAILKVETNGLPFIKMGDSDKIELGETVLAIGNSLGEFDDTISMGIISGLSRRITAYAGINTGATSLGGLIQTDAAINPGNSGGCLVDMDAQVIGINTATVMGAQNIGFAIPVNYAKTMLEEVKKFGKIKRPFLGLRYFILNEHVAKSNNIPVDYGALIVRERLGDPAVVKGSPADKANLKEFDIILECGEEKITESHNLGDILQKHDVGDELMFTVWRDGQQFVTKVKLEEKV